MMKGSAVFLIFVMVTLFCGGTFIANMIEPNRIGAAIFSAIATLMAAIGAALVFNDNADDSNIYNWDDPNAQKENDDDTK